MNIKLISLACLVSALIGAAITERFFVKTKTVNVEHEVVHDNIKTVVHTVTLPNGATDSTTTTIDNSVRTIVDVSKTQSVQKTSKLNLSALVANDFSRGILIPVYGISVQKEFIGPVTLGAFGLTNGTIGVSIGFNF